MLLCEYVHAISTCPFKLLARTSLTCYSQWIENGRSIFPQPGLPLGFLFSLKGIGWCGPSGRFPRNGPPVPPAPVAGSPKTAF